MRKYLFFFLCSLAGMPVAVCQAGAPSIAFDSTSSDLGRVMQGEIAKHIFAFTNKGTATLEIRSVETS